MCHILHSVCSQAIYECGRKQNNHKLKPDVRDVVYCFLYPEEYALPEKNEGTPTTAQATRKSLKKISTNFISSR